MWYKNIRAQNFLILILSAAGLTWTFFMITARPVLSPEEKLQVQEIVYADIIDYISAHPAEDPDYFFLSLDGQDPSGRIRDHFRSKDPRVLPVSSSERTIGFTAPVVYRSDRSKRGMVIDIKMIEKQPDGRVIARMALYKDRGTSATYDYRLSKNDGEFHVVSVQYPPALDPGSTP